MRQTVKNISFSVIIPVYNGEKTIERTIDSVLAQICKPHEIIVVDDASTDNTPTLLKKKYGAAIRLVEKKKNEGSSVARNEGMDVATGDYVAFLDADDIWHREKLGLINAILSSHPAIALFFHGYTQDDISGNEVPATVAPEKLLFVRLLPGNFIATSCIVMRNDLSFRFEPTMRYTEDYDLCLRVAYTHNIFYTNLALTQIFRGFTTSGGISGNKWLMRLGEMRAYSRLAKLNWLFVFLIPVLWAYSLLKHFLKKTGIVKR